MRFFVICVILKIALLLSYHFFHHSTLFLFMTKHRFISILLFSIVFQFCCAFRLYANVIPMIKQGLAVSLTPNASYIRASDFDAGSFVEGNACGKPPILSFDANAKVLTMPINKCKGINIVFIYITNACDSTDQAKVNTYIELQDNLLLDVSPCPPVFSTCEQDDSLLPTNSNKIYPMLVAMQGIAFCPPDMQGDFFLKWDSHFNSGSKANEGDMTKKHIEIPPLTSTSSIPPTNWSNSALVKCQDCNGLRLIEIWGENTPKNINFVITYVDIQTPLSNNANQPAVALYQGVATRKAFDKKLTLPAKAFNAGSYSPINSPLTFKFDDNTINKEIAVPTLQQIIIVAKDFVGNKNLAKTYIDVQTETLIKGAFSLEASNTVSTYTATEPNINFTWFLDNEQVAENIDTYQTPANLSVGVHRLIMLLKDQGGKCSDKAVLDITVRQSVATTPLPNKETIRVYPNPVTDFLTIESTIEGDYSVEITDAVGRLLRKTTFTNTSKTIDCSDLLPNLYFVKVLKGAELLRIEKIVRVH